MDKMVEAPPVPSLDHMGVARRPLPELLGRLRESIARLREVSFESMVVDCDRLEEALTLLAALELVRRGEAELRQDAPFGDIIITGTRAEYGLLRWVMQGIKADPELTLQIIATGMHLSPEFGHTYREIEQDGFQIDRKVEMLTSSDTPVGIAKSMGLGLIGFADALNDLHPT